MAVKVSLTALVDNTLWLVPALCSYDSSQLRIFEKFLRTQLLVAHL